ncbi:ALA-interacting subunit 5-like [Lolium rigidum]|uniref:ALA-interacting subunit 5-like n=1 Tax=Lolium rigidum TaxID=89674 RepID=UPI001F5CADEE|nr:ALA-interacting subunit 5-like [Lolium rigidum]
MARARRAGRGGGRIGGGGSLPSVRLEADHARRARSDGARKRAGRRWPRRCARRPTRSEVGDEEAEAPPAGSCSPPLPALSPRGDSDRDDEDGPTLTCGSSAEAAPLEVKPEQMDPSELDGDARKTNKPKYSKFTQQELPACKPLLTPGIVITAFLLIAFLFIPIGVVTLNASLQVVELAERYDMSCVHTDDKIGFIQNSKIDKTCTLNFTVHKHMKSPIHVYYQIGNFYQNHRRYVKSRSDKQLRYKNAAHLTKECYPEDNAHGAPIVPCGLVAWSFFNDTYTVKVNGETIEVNKKGIAWKSDKNNKFGSDIYPSNFQKGGLIGGAKLNESIPLSEQEDLIVWMRTAALPTFRKLYGRIEKDIMANDTITVVIQNNYNTYSIGGSKSVVLSTASWIGGRNNFIGIAYLTIGGLCLSLALGFIVVLYMVKPRTLGDPLYMSWNRDE